MVKVSVVKCNSYSEEDVKIAVRKSLEFLGGLERFVKPGMKVLLKVNLLEARKPEEGVTTNPAVVKAVAELCIERKAKVFVGDSAAVSAFEKAAETAGFAEVCRQTGAKLVELSEPVEKLTPRAFAARKLFVSAKLEGFDVIINLPKLKTHSFTGFTGAVKNLYGCVPKMIKGQYHLRFASVEQFCKMLLDLHELVRPGLSIMDAVVGMQGDGPSAGSLKEIGVLIASENAIALDFVALKAVGLNLEEIPTAVLAQKLGIINYGEVEVLPEGLKFPVVEGFEPSKAFYSNFNKMRFLLKVLKPGFDQKPFLVPENCTSCEKCFQACPAKAIDFKTKKPVFNYKKCIRCFCCQEVCPQKAIEIKAAFLLKAFRKFKGY